jgi:SH3-like domain-containing protein
MAVVFVGSALTLGSVVLIEKQTPAAIVVASKVQVMSAPNVEAVVLFDLHAGAQVRILEERGDWRRVTLPGEEFQGWMEAGDVEEVG